MLLLLGSSFLIGAVAAARSPVAKDNRVRSQCKKIVETQFPPNKWTTTEDLEAYSQLFSTTQDTVFENPAGNSDLALYNPTPSQVMEWFEIHGYMPMEGEYQYSSHITSPIMVTNKTCTFSSTVVTVVGGSCVFVSNSQQVITVDEQGKQVVYKDHWDENAFSKQFDDCRETLEGQSSNKKEEQPSKQSSKNSKKEEESSKKEESPTKSLRKKRHSTKHSKNEEYSGKYSKKESSKKEDEDDDDHDFDARVVIE